MEKGKKNDRFALKIKLLIALGLLLVVFLMFLAIGKWPETVKPTEQNPGSSTENVQTPDAGNSTENVQTPDAGSSSENAQTPDAGSFSENAQTPDAGNSSENVQTQDTGKAEKEEFLISLGNDLYITAIENFSGVYMEDGSDEVVQGLMMLKLENRGKKALQLCNITLDFGDAQACFDATNIPAGGTAVLIERNRMAYRGDVPVDYKAENVVFMDEFPMCEDVFKITTLDGIINVSNISDEDIVGDIYIYYKNFSGGIYYGGITYRVKIEGGLKAGEIRQLISTHYYEDASEILMVTYAS